MMNLSVQYVEHPEILRNIVVGVGVRVGITPTSDGVAHVVVDPTSFEVRDAFEWYPIDRHLTEEEWEKVREVAVDAVRSGKRGFVAPYDFVEIRDSEILVATDWPLGFWELSRFGPVTVVDLSADDRTVGWRNKSGVLVPLLYLAEWVAKRRFMAYEGVNRLLDKVEKTAA